MRSLAIITARSGSKGLPDKNIKLLGGKPLIGYTIEAALYSKQFDCVMVSTDSEEYASISRSFGADIPFLRSQETSSDRASSWDVAEEVLYGYEKQGRMFDSFCLLQPTSPFRDADDIVNAYRLFTNKGAIAVISMCELEHPLAWCGKIGEDNSLASFGVRENYGRRQDHTPDYRPNGAIYIVDTKAFREDRFLFREGAYAYIMPADRSIDIDTPEDFHYAEFLLSKKDENK